MMRRREFITLLSGGAAAWPLAARAQQRERTRRVGIILPAVGGDPEFEARLGAFLQELAQLGWAIGRNLQIDPHWAGGNAGEIRTHAAQLAASMPDVILAHGTSTVRPLLQETHSVPIVFPIAADPVADGFVDSLARPGGNVTGFMSFEYSLSGKWLQLIKQIAPAVTRAAVLQDPTQGGGPSQFVAIQAVAPALGMEVRPLNVRTQAEIEQAVATFARSPRGSLIVTATAPFNAQRNLVVKLAVQHSLPAAYYDRAFVTIGGLISYGTDYIDQYRRAAGYVDRILKGEKPADLPVQAPTKYQLAINMKTAKTLGLTVPPTLLVAADEVIE
jgi:putative ABC transport system substrate-binding protein